MTALEYVRWLASEGETLSEEELAVVRRGEDEIARGEYVTLPPRVSYEVRVVNVSAIGPRGDIYREI